MKPKTLLSVTMIAVLSVKLAGCGNGGSQTTGQATDYSISAHWLSLPPTVYAADIFYYYPTAWENTDSKPRICAINNASMLVGASEAFARQATAFDGVGNIYAPYYRQDNNSSIDREKVIGGIPTLDGIAAFDFYVKHYNNGRPFILAGHSQGANVLSNLLAGYMRQHPDVYKNMVAAYVIGYSVTAEYLNLNPHLKFAQGLDDTGVIISYNTQAPDVLPGQNPVLYAGVGLVINPITWITDVTLATQAEGLGSFMPDPVTKEFGPVSQYCDARIDTTNGVLICGTADEDELFALSPALGRGVYHTFDYPLYYYNLQANAANRIAKFLNKP